MFFVLSRIFACLASPLVYIIALFVWAVLSSNARTRRRLLIANAVLIVVFTNPWIYYGAEQLWLRGSICEADTTQHYDYALIPGGMTSYDSPRQRVEYGEAGDRIVSCAELYHKGLIDKIIITGDGASDFTGDRSVFLRHMELVYGIDSTRFVIETEARNTMQNFTNVIALMGNELTDKKILVINSGVFMPRTQLCCRKVGLAADYYTTDYKVPPKTPLWENLIPNFHLFDNWMSLGHELIGYAAYYVYF